MDITNIIITILVVAGAFLLFKNVFRPYLRNKPHTANVVRVMPAAQHTPAAPKKMWDAICKVPNDIWKVILISMLSIVVVWVMWGFDSRQAFVVAAFIGIGLWGAWKGGSARKWITPIITIVLLVMVVLGVEQSEFLLEDFRKEVRVATNPDIKRVRTRVTPQVQTVSTPAATNGWISGNAFEEYQVVTIPPGMKIQYTPNDPAFLDIAFQAPGKAECIPSQEFWIEYKWSVAACLRKKVENVDYQYRIVPQ